MYHLNMIYHPNLTTTYEFHSLLHLLRTHSFHQKRVILSSGRTSNFFIDCKQSALTAQGHFLIGTILYGYLLHNFESCAAVAGIELGGCSLASAVSLTSYLRGDPKNAFYIRKEAKNHGSKRLIEGNDGFENASVVVLEDVSTTGNSSLRAVNILQDAGYRVVGVLSLVDRLEGAKELFDTNNIPFKSVYTLNDFIK
jgi:orotate phosphoribosyltransferase